MFYQLIACTTNAHLKVTKAYDVLGLKRVLSLSVL